MNPNFDAKVKPTQAGWEQIRAHVKAQNKLYKFPKKCEMQVPVPDKEGYITKQFHALMCYFDWNKTCCELLFDDIQLLGKDDR